MAFGTFIEKELSMLQAIESASANYTNTVQAKGDKKRSFSQKNIMNQVNEFKNDDKSIKLDASLLNQFEQAFDCDLSAVRIHTGKYAEELTKQHNADAVTIGNDIYFANSKYEPDTGPGMALLAHELQHVIQNKNKERMAYPEDIAKAEYQASKVENALSQFRLHNIAGPMLSQAKAKLPVDQVSDHLQNDSIQDAMQSIADSDIEDIVQDSIKKTEYSIRLKSGKILTLSKADIESLYFEFERELNMLLQKMKNEYTPEAYEEKIIKFLEKVK